MTRDRPHGGTPPGHPRWEDTAPMPRLEPAPPPAAGPAAAPPLPGTPPKAEPPFTRVTRGLEMRELEGQTVFDQFFGADPPH